MKSNWSNFKLHEDIVKALALIKFERPSDVQERVLPYQKYGNDMIIASKTGSGKTLCFVLPVLSKIFLSMDNE